MLDIDTTNFQVKTDPTQDLTDHSQCGWICFP
jgi:hypothetical protein